MQKLQVGVCHIRVKVRLRAKISSTKISEAVGSNLFLFSYRQGFAHLFELNLLAVCSTCATRTGAVDRQMLILVVIFFGPPKPTLKDKSKYLENHLLGI